MAYFLAFAAGGLLGWFLGRLVLGVQLELRDEYPNIEEEA